MCIFLGCVFVRYIHIKRIGMSAAAAVAATGGWLCYGFAPHVYICIPGTDAEEGGSAVVPIIYVYIYS